jgi:tRNA1Val (adenine37-N6)-methyltransferase
MARNTSFQFKQFLVRQERCAMKVCTDACVFGAWVDVADAKKVLDIGAGTGLLSLMAAQRNPYIRIDAVEIDADAFYQAGENVEQSSFSDRIRVFHEPIQEFDPGYRYDVIITNPPFFQSDLLSPRESKNTAHHAGSLDFEALLTAAQKLLVEGGRFHVLLPVAEAAVFTSNASQKGWSLKKRLTLFHSPEKKPFRQMMSFVRNKSADNVLIECELNIYEKDGATYDPTFRDLLKDFYLKF